MLRRKRGLRKDGKVTRKIIMTYVIIRYPKKTRRIKDNSLLNSNMTCSNAIMIQVCYFTKQVLGRCFVSTKQSYSFKYNHRLTISTDFTHLTPVSLCNLPYYLDLIFPAQLQSVGQVRTLSIVTAQIRRERGVSLS